MRGNRPGRLRGAGGITCRREPGTPQYSVDGSTSRLRFVGNWPPTDRIERPRSGCWGTMCRRLTRSHGSNCGASWWTVFAAICQQQRAVQQQFEQLLSSHVPLGVLTDIVAFTIKLDVQVKQQLLQQLNVDRRAELLLTQLEQTRPQRHDSLRCFPPEFSLN